MPSSNVIRLGGLAALLGGALLITYGILWQFVGRATSEYPQSELATTWSYTAVNGLELLGVLLLLLGLVGLYAGQSKAAGTLGLVGFLMLFIGLALALSVVWFRLFVLPDLAVAAPEWVDANNTGWIRFGFTLPSLLTVPGWLLFAAATLRAGVYPRVAAIALLIGSVPLPDVFFLPLIAVMIRRAAVVWLGFALLTGRVASREEPAPSIDLVRWGAPAAVLAGAAFVVSSLVGIFTLVIPGQSREATFGTPSFYLVETVSFIGLVCLLGGLVGLHALQETSYGRLGLAGFLLAFVGAALYLDATSIGIEAGRTVNNLAPSGLGALSMLVGFVLLGIATLRARVLPWWCGVLLIVWLPVAVGLVIPLGESGEGIAFGLVWLALGYALWKRRGEPAGLPPRASEVPEETPSPS